MALKQINRATLVLLPLLLASCLRSFTPPSAASTSRGLRRLSHREYNNVVRDLLGDTSQPANQFGDEVYVNGFDNGSDGLTVQGSDVDAFQQAAETLAARAVSTNMGQLLGGCDPTTNEATCVDAFLSNFAKRAYRRPLSSGEQTRLHAVYSAGAAVNGFKGGIQLMLEAILQAPAFLYREELGTQIAPGYVHLTDYEIASELSFLITGSMPDDALFAAAEAGHLSAPDELRRQAMRLLQSPAAQPAFRAFLHQWMATDRLATLRKDPTVYPTFTPAVAQSMVSELDRYFDDSLWNGDGSLSTLLTSTRSFVDPQLAPIYAVQASGTDFQPVTLDQNRLGIFTRLGFLTAHSDTDSSGPVPRGVFILNSILCTPPSPPPPNVPPPPPVATSVSAHQTTRQRFDQHLSETFCRGCHTQIDGVGFGFEEFDGIGAYRTVENGSPVDSSGNLHGTDVDGAFNGASDLAGKLVDSEMVLNCYIKQVYRYSMGQQESAASQPLLTHLGAGFGPYAPMTKVFLSLITDPVFVDRTTAQ
jgi:hypothetical protein